MSRPSRVAVGVVMCAAAPPCWGIIWTRRQIPSRAYHAGIPPFSLEGCSHKKRALALILHNSIHHSRQHGILVLAGAGGDIRDNTIHNNIGRGVKSEVGAKAKGQTALK